ncbi:hypothetical protein ALC57_12607 [Trachymyrmex cornetzi]|uniref:Glycoprotein n=1 Tax=Trachymyrmex cornetzi TaxID=471704 RepID=A0A151J150_9HYME|nr:hypothetical protein ALC57_12607 [Trachymyrmex cornetzi]
MDSCIKGITAVIMLMMWTQETYGIIGYDCGSAAANLTTLSLINIEECDIPPQNVNSSKVYVQLLQLNDFNSVKVIQCKVEIDRTVKKCGMFSHSLDVHNGQFSYIADVTRDTCKHMHTYGTFEMAGTRIIGLKSNQIASRPIVLAGHVDNDGGCSGSAYSDPYGTWGNVIVLGSLKITLQDYIAEVRINTNRVHLRSGVGCELSSTHCTDIEGGDTFWDPLGDSWYKIMPKPVETLPPTVMKPSTKPSWKYISPGALATSGIYSQTDLEELKDHIMFPAERPAILNTMTRGILGHSTVMNGGSLSNLIDEASIERIAISAWKKFWNKFLIFGNISAGLIGIYLIARVIKLLLDTFVHGYAVHTVYGWSVYLLGAVWDSLTQLLLYLGRYKPKDENPSAPIQLLLHLGRYKPKDENPSAPDLELQEHNGTETKLEPVYSLLPPREETAYTLELKN